MITHACFGSSDQHVSAVDGDFKTADNGHDLIVVYGAVRALTRCKQHTTSAKLMFVYTPQNAQLHCMEARLDCHLGMASSLP